MQETIVAIVAGFFVKLFGLVLIHSVWLKQDYIDTAALWRPMPSQLSQSLGLVRACVSAFCWRFRLLFYSALSSWVILPVRLCLS
jgi:hypothetical protein